MTEFKLKSLNVDFIVDEVNVNMRSIYIGNVPEGSREGIERAIRWAYQQGKKDKCKEIREFLGGGI